MVVWRPSIPPTHPPTHLLVVGVGGDDDEAVPAADFLEDANKHFPVGKPT